MKRHHKHARYKNLTIFTLSTIFAIALSQHEAFRNLLLSAGNYGYLSAIIAGFMFALSFAVPTSVVIIATLTDSHGVVSTALFASLGAVVGNHIVYKIVKDKLEGEIKNLYEDFGGDHLAHALHTKYFAWTLPLIGSLIIVTPLPDALGVSLLGISKMKEWQVLGVSFLLHFITIIALAYTFSLF